MSFISYAQNLEDVILHRALKHVEKGFYIDVGANHPRFDSVTFAFYERGWNGINIDPVEEWIDLLNKERNRDINLRMAAGETQGTTTIYAVKSTGLSTSNEKLGEIYQEDNTKTVEPIISIMDTLTHVCRQFASGPIHFLKIDVEGEESSVIKGMDLTQYRPWIILAEATIPNSVKENYADWDELLKNNAYKFSYFDGLNRFYIAEEKEELSQYFTSPPNVHDDYIRDSEFRLIEENRWLREVNEKLEARLATSPTASD